MAFRDAAAFLSPAHASVWSGCRDDTAAACRRGPIRWHARRAAAAAPPLLQQRRQLRRRLLDGGSVTMALSVASKGLPASVVQVDISVSADEVAAAYEAAAQELATENDLPSPTTVEAVTAALGAPVVASAAVGRVIDTAVPAALSELSLKPLGQVRLADHVDATALVAAASPSAPLAFAVALDVWPVATLTGPHRGLAVTAVRPAGSAGTATTSAADVAAATDAAVEAALLRMRTAEATYVPVVGAEAAGRVATAGDGAVISLAGFVRQPDGSRGEPLPDGIGDGEPVELPLTPGGGPMPAFVDAVLGLAVGETGTAEVVFPPTAGRVELRGVAAIFDVTLLSITEPVLPPLDDTFAAAVAPPARTVADLRASVRATLAAESAAADAEAVASGVEDALLAITSVDVPATLIEEGVRRRYARLLTGLKAQGAVPPSEWAAMVTPDRYEAYKAGAVDGVARGLILNFGIAAVAAAEGLAPPPAAEVDDQVELARLALKGEPMEDEPAVRDRIIAHLERQAVMAVLMESAVVTWVDGEVGVPEATEAAV